MAFEIFKCPNALLRVGHRKEADLTAQLTKGSTTEKEAELEQNLSTYIFLLICKGSSDVFLCTLLVLTKTLKRKTIMRKN